MAGAAEEVCSGSEEQPRLVEVESRSPPSRERPNALECT